MRVRRIGSGSVSEPWHRRHAAHVRAPGRMEDGARTRRRVTTLLNNIPLRQQTASSGPTTDEALVRVQAFRKLVLWRKKLSIGVGAVKEFYCTDDASGMNEAIGNTLSAIAAVTAARGRVDYLSMDEPWVSGRSRKCGGPALEPTADRVALYHVIGRSHPSFHEDRPD